MFITIKWLIINKQKDFAYKREKNICWYYFTQVESLPICNLRRCCMYFTQVWEMTCNYFTQVAVSFLRRWWTDLKLLYAGQQLTLLTFIIWNGNWVKTFYAGTRVRIAEIMELSRLMIVCFLQIPCSDKTSKIFPSRFIIFWIVRYINIKISFSWFGIAFCYVETKIQSYLFWNYRKYNFG